MPRIPKQWCIPTTMSRLSTCLHQADRWTVPKNVQRIRPSLKNNYSNSVYAQQLIYHGHSLGQIEDIMDIIFTMHRGKQLDTD